MSKKAKPEKHDQNAAASATKRRDRRRLIQTLALGGGIASSKLVPSTWIAPAVQTVVLPAHAAGSECTLGNSEVAPIDVVEAVGPGPVQDVAELLSALVPEAQAGDGDRRLRLTGCFWIEFLCNSNKGTLWATTDDGDQSAPFTSGEEGDFFGYCFIVTLQNGGGSANLTIGDGESCRDQTSPILLNDPNPSCTPCDIETDEGKPICGDGN